MVAPGSPPEIPQCPPDRKPARRKVIWSLFLQSGFLETLRLPPNTAWPEVAALWRIHQIGRQSTDRHEFFLDRLTKLRNGIEKSHCVRVLGMIENVVGGALFDDLARIHHDHALANFGHDTEIVSDHDDRRAEIAIEPVHQIENLSLNGHIERGCRLVGDQHSRIAGQRDGDHHALSHSAGELMRIGVEPFFGGGNADSLQQIDRALFGLFRPSPR